MLLGGRMSLPIGKLLEKKKKRAMWKTDTWADPLSPSIGPQRMHNNNNNNNNRFLYSAFSKLWSKRFTLYYYPGHRIQNQFCTQSALSPLPGEQSRQSAFYRRAQCQLNHNIVRILPGPHLTPGSRAAMWIKCLAEGQKYRATVGFEPGLSTWESSGHTTIPRHHNQLFVHHGLVKRHPEEHFFFCSASGKPCFKQVQQILFQSKPCWIWISYCVILRCFIVSIMEWRCIDHYHSENFVVKAGYISYMNWIFLMKLKFECGENEN